MSKLRNTDVLRSAGTPNIPHLLAPPPWVADALCAQTDPEAFYPEKGGCTREAKKVCLTCEVRDECLQAALDNDERFGIWGRLSERERRKLKGPRQSSTPAARRPKVERQRIRAWAVTQGLNVATTGNLPRAVQLAYAEAHPTAAEHVA